MFIQYKEIQSIHLIGILCRCHPSWSLRFLTQTRTLTANVFFLFSSLPQCIYLHCLHSKQLIDEWTNELKSTIIMWWHFCQEKKIKSVFVSKRENRRTSKGTGACARASIANNVKHCDALFSFRSSYFQHTHTHQMTPKSVVLLIKSRCHWRIQRYQRTRLLNVVLSTSIILPRYRRLFFAILYHYSLSIFLSLSFFLESISFSVFGK